METPLSATQQQYQDEVQKRNYTVRLVGATPGRGVDYEVSSRKPCEFRHDSTTRAKLALLVEAPPETISFRFLDENTAAVLVKEGA